MTAATYTLPNGLEVILHENHTTPVVAVQAWVRVGSADEPEELAGIAHVFEHMLFKGTRRRGVGEIAREVESSGGEINAWTSFDQTVYHLVLASRFLDQGLDILGDALQNSSFDPGELERELKVVLEEVRQGEDNPSRVLTQALFHAAYQQHPYRRPVIGYSRTVQGFTRDRLLEFFRRHYVASNMTLVVAGDFDPAVARRRIESVFGALPKAPRPTHGPRQEPVQAAPRAVVVGRDVREAHLSIGFHIPGVRHEDVAALDVLAVVLGQGESSRLVSGLRRERGVVSDVFSYAYTPKDPGLFVAGALLPPERLHEAHDAILEQVFRLRFEEISEAELEKARAILESDAVYQRETVQGMARKLGFFATQAGSLDAELVHAARVRAVTPRTLREVAERYLRPEGATVAALVPRAGKGGKADAEGGLGAKLKARLAPAFAEAQARFGGGGARPTPGEGGVVRLTLPSGARLLVQRDPSVGVVAMRAAWMGGLRREDEKVNGVNHLLAQLVTQGTRTRTAQEIAHEVEAMAGSIGGMAGKNSFGVRVEVLARHWERALEILADCVLNPAFRDEDLERERRQVLEEIRAQQDNVAAEAFRLFSQTLYPKHPYRLDTIGTAQSVSGLTRRRLVDYYRRHVAPEEMTLAIVGDVDPEAVARKALALFGPARERPALRLVDPPTDAPPAAPIEAVRHQNKQQAHLVYGFPGTTLRSKDRFALEVLATVLSGQGGRLFLELRDKRGLAYRVSAYSVEGVDPGYFAVYLATSPGNLEVALAGIRDELSRLSAAPLAAAELERAKRYLVGTHDIALQRRSALAASLAFNECYGLGWDEHRRYGAGIMAVTAEEAQRVARRYLDPGRAVLAVIRPDAEAPVLARPKAGPRPAGARALAAKRARKR